MSTMYTPLKASRREIRLISIRSDLHKHNGSNTPRDSIPDGTLMCTMITVSLKDWTPDYAAFRAKAIDWPYSPTTLYEEWEHFSREQNGSTDDDTPTPGRFVWGDYETISYTWENGSNTQHTIYVNDRPFLIQDNLYHALQEFRESKDFVEGRKRMLWADAICINQNNLDERATEVKRMKEIFSTATRSTVWLGPSLYLKGVDTKTYFDLVDRLIGKLCPSAITNDSSTGDLQPTSAELILSKAGSSGGRGQEDRESRALSEEALAVLSQFDPAGRPSISALATLSAKGRLLALIFPIFRLDYWTRVWIIQELTVSSSRTIVRAGSSQIPFVRLSWFAECFVNATDELNCSPDEEHSRTIMSNLFLLGTICEIKLQHQSDQWERSHEYIIIIHGLMSRSSLPLDKLYGVLGLLRPATCLGIDVDYRRTVRQGSIDASLALIRAGKTIESFYIRREFQSLRVPSWAVDLSVDQDLSSSIVAYFHRRDSAEIPEVNWTLFWKRQVEHSDQGILILRGTYLDTIDGVAACAPADSRCLANASRKFDLPRSIEYSMTQPTRSCHSYRDDFEILGHLDAILRTVPNWGTDKFGNKYYAEGSPDVFQLGTLAVNVEADSNGSSGSNPVGVSGLSAGTAADLTFLKQFLDASADFRVWKQKLSLFFPGIGQKPGSILTSQTAESPRTLDTDGSKALEGMMKHVEMWALGQVRLITTTGGYLGVAAQLARHGDMVYAVEGYGGPVILRPIENTDTFEFIGLAEIWSPAVSGTWENMEFDCIVRLQ